jgi:enoyl-CoA hydratase/carnithine racemase
MDKLEQRDGSIVWVTLARPSQANALDCLTISELQRILDEAQKDPSARAIVFLGAGRHFCGGADLNELLTGGVSGIRPFLDDFRNFLNALERSPLIAIAAVHGAVIAGGLELALCCDLIVAARSARFADGHARNGLLPGGGSTARLPRAIGWQRAKWLLLSGASIDAETACKWGLVHAVVEEFDLRKTAENLVTELTRTDRDVTDKLKRLLADTSERRLSESLDAEIVTLEAHYPSKAFQAGIAAFLQRPRDRR